ncbi:hypothetical protein [Streptomyces sp. NPDC087512]|uniref:hypothetical protein n=1 Tax=unclassified Streptomyces TaxID=2593676 RepID=UPI00342D8A62
MKRTAQGRAHARLRGVLALLVAVVGLLCVFGHVERGGGQDTSLPVAEHAHALTVSEASDGTAPPCGKKGIADHSGQRAETPSSSATCPGTASPHSEPAHPPSRHSGILAGSPAPPPAPLHSVLRI